jgi:diguanylate cyclase (GGDEF)-like protein/PAS domain S-box-containing protein
MQTMLEHADMNAVIIPGLYLLAGICVYAAINHLSYGLRRLDLVHVMFAGLCLLMVPFTLSHTSTMQATDIDGYVAALKFNLAVIFLFLILFPWLIAKYTGKRLLPLLLALSVLLAVLLVADVMLPYSLQYDDISGLRTLHLPWGEAVTRGVGKNGSWAYIASVSALLVFGYTLYALTSLYLSTRSRAALGMMFAVVLFLLASIEGILVRLSIIDFVELGPFGYLGMVIVMSMVLSRESQQRLNVSENRFRSMVEQSPFSIQMLSPDGYTLQVNAAWEKLWGVKQEAIADYNILEDQQLVEKGAMAYIEQGFAGAASEIPPIVYNPADNPVVRGPMRDRWVRSYIYPIKDEAGIIREMVLVHEDVTEKKRVEDAIRLIAAGVAAETGERFFQQLVQSLVSLFDTDLAFIALLDDSDTQCVNTIAVCDHGQIAADFSYPLPGTPCATVVGQTTCAYPRDVQRLFPKDRMLVERGAESYIGTPLFDEQKKPLGIIVMLDGKPFERIERVKDILEIFATRAGTEVQRLRAESHIRRMAYQDYLTGLASRVHLHERLLEVLNRVRLSGEGGALVLIDLDHFKTINDALGHDVGDEVLRAVARRLTETVSARGFLARLGGDEFVVLLTTDTRSTREAENEVHELAREIMESMTSPIDVGERNFTIGASIGVALFPKNGETELDILRHADMALYQAKSMGRGMIQFYMPSLQTAAASRLYLEEGLRRVIVNNELELYFQPLVDVSGQMVGAEALLRWHHPELGDIPPATFIPVAEETGLIQSIGGWVLEQACVQLARWLHSGEPFVGHLSINVCPWQFAHPDYVQLVRRTLDNHQVDAHHLMLELTETALLYDIKETADKLKALRSLGFKIALDDFGTGYSSLAYLKDLPLDLIKIDRAFVSELSVSAEHPLVESMIAIGQHMRLGVIAEGVESVIQRDTLIKLGCEMFQGYLFSHPLPEQQFLQWMAENQTDG